MLTQYLRIFALALVLLGISTFLAKSDNINSKPSDGAIFEDSCVREIASWKVHEEFDGLPEDIFPAYIGSGKIGIGIDASGMQNLDCRIGEGPRYTNTPYEHKDDLYIFAEGMISSHIIPNNLMPLGYLKYDISIDDKPISLRDSVNKWQRDIDIQQAIVKTTLSLKQGIELEITGFTPQETMQAYFRFQTKSTDGNNHLVLIRPQVSLKMRSRNGGTYILDRVTARSQSDGSATVSGEVTRAGKYSPLEDYSLIYQVNAQNSWMSYEGLGCEMRFMAKEQPSSQDVEFNLGMEEEALPYNLALDAHKNDWSSFYGTGAQISIGDVKREFLFNNSLYLLRIGGTYNKGFPEQFLLFHPENWYGCTFWDLDFIIDALIKTNHLEQAKRTLKWLNAVAGPEGSRPFHWMTLYNGESGMPKEGKDTGIYVNASHAMSAIRLYETTQDRNFLKSTLYPILRKVSVYAANQFFIKEDDHYIGAGSGIDANTDVHENDTFSTIWFGVILKKTAEYARLLGIDASESVKWEMIANNIRLDTCDRGYKFCREWEGPDGFVWMLLYPTECMPLIDMSIYNKCRNDMYFGNLGQPWCYFWQASSDFRTGLDTADSSERYITEGLRFTYGPGYFAEGIPGDKPMEGLPPYATAHASYLTASIEQLILSSIWNDEINVFTNLPSSMQNRHISFKNIRTSRGVVISGSYDPRNIYLNINGIGKAELKIQLPKNIEYDTISININGIQISAIPKNHMLPITIPFNGEDSVAVTIKW